ncbi:chemotaxis protein CheD [Desulfocarbo indianensis]|nr:chemotaxis protein CheD [Desulfocarbo indianensis]
MSGKIIIGVGDLAVSNKRGAELVTYSLGSCIGVIIHDAAACVGGLLHLMLPDSNLNPERARNQPGVFADTGLPLLFKKAYQLGAKKGRLRVVVVGGSQVMDASGHFNIGKRNYAMVRKIFWRNNVLIDKEDVGGNVNRTVGLEVGNGRLWVKTNGAEVKSL